MAATSKEIVSGVGARLAEVFNLDSDGLPSVNSSSATPVTGTLVQGIKTFTYEDPDPVRHSHYGQDRVFAQDSTPPTEGGSFTMTTAKTNLILDAMFEGNKVASIDGIPMRVVNSDKRGNEPQVFISVFRQALDTKKDSATFGKLRQYHAAFIPSSRVSPSAQSMEQATTDKSYTGTPTNITVTPWNQAFDETTWGASQGEYVEAVLDYKPRWNWYLGNGTITAFQLSKPPVDSAHLHIWVDGTLTTPSAVNTSTANPAFTLSSAPGVSKKVGALIEYNVAD